MSDDTFTREEIEQAIARGLRATSEVKLAKIAQHVLEQAAIDKAQTLAKIEDAIKHIRKLGHVLPGTGSVGSVSSGEAARLAYLDAERCIRRAFGLPDIAFDAQGFVKQGLADWPPKGGS